MIHFAAGAAGSPVGSVRDLELLANMPNTSRPDGVLVDVLDRPGDMVFVDQVNGISTVSFLDVEGVDSAIVRADQSGGGYSRMLSVTGGGAGAQGSGATRGVVMFGGGGAAVDGLGVLQGYGKAVLVGTDNEGNTQGLTLGGSGFLTMDGGRLRAAAGAEVLVQSTFQGNVAVMNLDDTAPVVSTDNPVARVLSMSNGLSISPCSAVCSFNQQQNPAALAGGIQMGIYNLDVCGSGITCEQSPSTASDPMATVPSAPAFVASMVSDLRSTRAAPAVPPCGAANVRLHRVNLIGLDANLAGPAVHVKHN
jgi:hypothetical protein